MIRLKVIVWYGLARQPVLAPSCALRDGQARFRRALIELLESGKTPIGRDLAVAAVTALRDVRAHDGGVLSDG